MPADNKMNKVPTGKGKADADIKGKGPGPIRGSEFGKSNIGPTQGEASPQPKGAKFQRDQGGWRGEGEGDAACGDM
jgi:hypothetical protein